MNNVRILAAKITTAAISLSFISPIPVVAGIPVVDGTNLTQNIMSAMESVTQTAKQIQQYQTQLQQYENQLQNTMAPAAYIWDQAQSTIDDLTHATNTLAYYQNQLGSLDAYLSKFQDVDYYRSSPCFNGSGGCTPAEQARMEENRRLASESQKTANDALFESLKLQHKNLQADARQLHRLQSAAQGADGQLAAIGYANQLASNQANQLLQIRSLLIAQQNAVGSRMQAEADREAQYQASRERLFDMGDPTDRSKNRGF
ncbi:P-type conjugative transfer protein TrbJ [Vibrio parahaemolyticus]|uniref:P-type conjugative transfer protein TrbJ n=1 Tax=Vibrio parahaemolyticus TaxID=670 RepID=UPI0003ED8DA0|nr:P-type conjugative transfer protein TrbJ [Vibrio parahaemolyticus]AHI98565.1 Conjugative transfer protein TrbJ [Vibrio parahaemolyticus UCM-V493]EJG1162651.1 P-type conjugative transfer protein TrbJ [Vibrio parahaemolyticus]EJL8303639.1 P-type conjugative transfer protein TrbJ [Vibrio parahaemolyticus]EJU9846114.1 P-type conjugative transfer protein TrbJ [Vibrio parahaemolyticus]EKZ9216204.1 P-type conjugative transfer protein TrbJ [Vibrio parahaemolyticus]